MAALAAGLAALAVGCGESEREDSAAEDRAAVRRTVSAYLRAYSSGEGERACALYTPELRAIAERKARARGAGSCARVLSIVGPELVAGAPRARRAALVDRVTDPAQVRVRLRGDRASAALSDRPSTHLELRRVGDRWLIDRLGVRGPF